MFVFCCYFFFFFFFLLSENYTLGPLQVLPNSEIVSGFCNLPISVMRSSSYETGHKNYSKLGNL